MGSPGLQHRSLYLSGAVVQTHLQFECSGLPLAVTIPSPDLFKTAWQPNDAAVTDIYPFESFNDWYGYRLPLDDHLHHAFQHSLHEIRRLLAKALFQPLRADRFSLHG